jgi:hypothetical protein
VSGVTLNGSAGPPDHFYLGGGSGFAARHWFIIDWSTWAPWWCTITIVVMACAWSACWCRATCPLGGGLQRTDRVMEHEAATLWHFEQHRETVERPDSADQALTIDQVNLEHCALTAPLVQCRELYGSAGFGGRTFCLSFSHRFNDATVMPV